MPLSEPAAEPQSGWRFMTDEEAGTVEAVTARIVPSEPGLPGAREAQVVRFIDRALSESSAELGAAYRTGLSELEARCQREHGVSFAALEEGVQDRVLLDIDTPPILTNPLGGEEAIAHGLRTFFAIVREHTVQGMFCDPVYGGNHEAVGWRLVGFPGAQWGYQPDQMVAGYDSTVIPVKTLADLRRERPLNDGSMPHHGSGSDT